MLQALAGAEPKLRIVSQNPIERFPDGPENGNQWMEMARAECQYSMQLSLDGDEILDPSSYPGILLAVAQGEPRIFTYVNFWLDAQHICPWGDGRKMHLIPSNCPISCHGTAPSGYESMRQVARSDPSLVSYHYSALRRRDAFFAKCKVMAKRFNEDYADQALIWAEKDGIDFAPLYPERMDSLSDFTGRHPDFMHRWLLDRGWKLK